MRKDTCTDHQDKRPLFEAQESCFHTNIFVEEEPSCIKNANVDDESFVRNYVQRNEKMPSKHENLPNDQKKSFYKQKGEDNNVVIIILNNDERTRNSSKRKSQKIVDLSSAVQNENLTDDIMVENVHLSLKQIRKVHEDVSNVISLTKKNNEKSQQQNIEVGPKCFLVLNSSLAADKFNHSSSLSSSKKQNIISRTKKDHDDISTLSSRNSTENNDMLEDHSYILIVKGGNSNQDSCQMQNDQSSLNTEKVKTDDQQSVQESEEENQSQIASSMIKRNYEKQKREIIVKKEGDVEYYFCDVCDKRYTSIKSLKTHHYARCSRRRQQISKMGAKRLGKKDLNEDVKRKAKICEVSMARANQNKIFSCRKCGDSFEDRSEYWSHSRSRCKVLRPVICEYCGKMFLHRSSFHKHWKWHVNPSEVHCPDCRKAFKNPILLRSHVNKVHMGLKEFYLCSHCGIKSKSKSHIEAHEKSHFLSEGETLERPFSCECGKSFISQHELSNHKYVNHVNKKCPHCSERFTSTNKLVQHKKRFHPAKYGLNGRQDAATKTNVGHGMRAPTTNQNSADHSQKCPLCEKVYSSHACLKYHLFRAHGLDDPSVAKRADCTLCIRSYTSLAYYVYHKRSVHGQPVSAEEIEAFRNYEAPPDKLAAFEARKSRRRLPRNTEHECDVCNRVYSRRQAMLTHRKMMHGDELCFCEPCQLTFMNRGQFVRHRYEVHTRCGDDRTCRICGKVFDKIRSLWAHKIVHEQYTRFNCDRCESRFKRKGDLTRHLRDKHAVPSTYLDSFYRKPALDDAPDTVNESSVIFDNFVTMSVL